MAYGLGKGPTIGWGPNIHPALFKSFKEMAEELDIPYRGEAMPRHSGTDAYAMQSRAEGIPTLVLGIPLRYMHTPVEVVALKDIARSGRLLAEFIARLKPDYMETLLGRVTDHEPSRRLTPNQIALLEKPVQRLRRLRR